MNPLSPSRRRALKALAAAPFALRLAGASAATSGPTRRLVLVYLYGGNDAYNTWVPYTNALYYSVRPNIAVARDSVLKVTDHHGFHPSLSALAPAWEARELALVQGIGYAQATQQHYRDEEIAFTAEDGDLLRDGWITRALAPRDDGGLADAIAFDMLDTRQADPMGPFRGDRLGVIQMHYPDEFVARRRIADCVTATNTRGAAMLKRATRTYAPVPLKTSFPDDPFGQSVRAAVELIASEPSVPAIHLVLNGLDGDKHHSVDCHWDQAKYHGEALRRLGEGLAALRSGLIEAGQWNSTLVATYDEFGRSPMENEDRGTHHGLASTHFVLGGAVRGGLIGEPTRFERLYPIGGVAPTIDTRRLWSTVITRWWQRDAGPVFRKRYEPLDLLRA